MSAVLPAAFSELAARPAAPTIGRISYTHDAMIDLIVAEPAISQREIAARFGYTEAWISIIFSSDAFQSRLAERKAELIDPAIRATVEERFRALIQVSQQKLLERLTGVGPALSEEGLLKTLEIGARALGYGAVKAQQTNNVQFVVQLPAPAPSGVEWASQFGPQKEPLDGDPGGNSGAA